MTATYDCIAATTLGSDSASVTFSSISGAFTDLILVMNILPLSTNDNLGIKFNSTNGPYGLIQVTGGGASPASNRGSNLSSITAGAIYDSAVTTHVFHIMNYSNTTTNKTMLYRYGNSSYTIVAGVIIWRDNSAITSISIAVNGGSNLSANSTFSLYGIKAE